MKKRVTALLILFSLFFFSCSDDDSSSGSTGNRYVPDEVLPYSFREDTLHIYTPTDTFSCYNGAIAQDTLHLPAEMSNEEMRATPPTEIMFVMTFTRVGEGTTIIGNWIFLRPAYMVISGELTEEEKIEYDEIIDEFIMFYPPGMIKLTVEADTIRSYVLEAAME